LTASSLYVFYTFHAQSLAEIVLQWLDHRPSSARIQRSRVIIILLKLAANSGRIPRGLFLDNVVMGAARDAAEFGGFADVFRGAHNGSDVAIKRLRISKEDRAAVHSVCPAP
jgi:hypothetical protein